MARSDRVLADAEALLHRVSPEGRRLAERARRRRFQARMRTLGRMALAMVAVVAGSILWGVAVGPIGQLGFLAAVAALVAAWIAIVIASHEPAESSATLGTSDLPELPARTETWLQQQRPLLPAPAVRLADQIGARLETLGPQLAGLDPAQPVAARARKLLAQELPDLVGGYARVPSDLRRVARDGPAPDAQLIEGLGVVEQELARMSADLASGDLHKLATQNRYLELKYRDGEQGQTPMS